MTPKNLRELHNAARTAAGSRVLKSCCDARIFLALEDACLAWPLDRKALRNLEAAVQDVLAEPVVRLAADERLLSDLTEAVAATMGEDAATLDHEMARFAEERFQGAMKRRGFA